MVYGVTGSQGNMFKPGTMTGTAPVFENYPKGAGAYKMEWNNLAPSVGVAWRPKVDGFLGTILSTRASVPRRVLAELQPLCHRRLHQRSTAANPGAEPHGAREARRPARQPSGTTGFPVLLRDTAKLYPSARSPVRRPTRSPRRSTRAITRTILT